MPQAIPPSPCSALPPPHGSFSRLDFGFTLICLVATRSTGTFCPAHLPPCPPLLSCCLTSSFGHLLLSAPFLLFFHLHTSPLLMSSSSLLLSPTSSSPLLSTTSPLSTQSYSLQHGLSCGSFILPRVTCLVVCTGEQTHI